MAPDRRAVRVQAIRTRRRWLAGLREAEGEAGAGDKAGFPVAGEVLDAEGLGGGQPDRGMLGGQGWPSRTGTGAFPG